MGFGKVCGVQLNWSKMLVCSLILPVRITDPYLTGPVLSPTSSQHHTSPTLNPTITAKSKQTDHVAEHKYLIEGEHGKSESILLRCLSVFYSSNLHMCFVFNPTLLTHKTRQKLNSASQL